MGVLSDIRAIIQAAIPSESVVALFKEPDTPPVCTTLYGTGGPVAITDYSGGAHGPRTGQVRIRDPVASACESRTESLYRLFVAIRYYPAYHLWIQASTAPFYSYPQDANANFIASFNIIVTQSG